MLELRILGPLEAHGRDGRVALRPMERRLLAAFAVRRSAWLGVDELIDVLWPGAAPRSAAHTLRTHLTRVRQAVGADCIVATGGGYHLGAAVTVDADSFEHLVYEATRTGGLEVWTSVLALWRGEPLVELADWAPAEAERARLIELGHAAREGWCEAAIARSDAVDAVAELERLAQAEPLREHRWALLMRALDAGGRRAEALRAYDRARRTLSAELGIHPGAELEELHRSLLTTDGSPPASRSTGRLPATMSTFVGRDADVAVIAEALTRHRLVTLTGVGGVGKSRLALIAATGVAPQFAAGAWFVGLAGASDGRDIDEIVAAAIGPLVADRQRLRARIAEAIGGRQMLLLVDNCEHLLDQVAELVSDLLADCPGLVVLATSRSPLSIAGERRIDVRPLELDSSARQLLLTRATEAGATIGPDADDVLDDLGRRLGGIPLVIELAARHVAALGPTAVLERLTLRLDVAPDGRRGGERHHRTVRDALDWSWNLLDPTSRDVFARLGMFAGPFDEAAVHGVSGGVVGPDAPDSLARLVDASMVVAQQTRSPRFLLLEPVRRYALERLAATGRTDEVSRCHASYMTERAESLGRQLAGPTEIAAAAELVEIRADVRAAFHSSTARGDVDRAFRLILAVTDDANVRLWTEPWSWCEQVLDLPSAADHPARPALLAVAASAALWQAGLPHRCVALADQAITTTEPHDEAWVEAMTMRANGLLWLDRIDECVASIRAAVATDRQPRSPRGMRRRGNLALILNQVGQPDAGVAARLLADAVAGQHPSTMALAHHVQGVLLAPHEPATALTHQEHAAELAAASGAVVVHGFALAALAAGHRDPTRRAHAITAVMAHYLRYGNRAHLRSFGRGLIAPLAELEDWTAIVIVDAATHDQPLFGREAGRVDDAVDRAKALVGDTEDLASRARAMSDDELVHWAQHHLA